MGLAKKVLKSTSLYWSLQVVLLMSVVVGTVVLNQSSQSAYGAVKSATYLIIFNVLAVGRSWIGERVSKGLSKVHVCALLILLIGHRPIEDLTLNRGFETSHPAVFWAALVSYFAIAAVCWGLTIVGFLPKKGSEIEGAG